MYCRPEARTDEEEEVVGIPIMSTQLLLQLMMMMMTMTMLMAKIGHMWQSEGVPTYGNHPGSQGQRHG